MDIYSKIGLNCHRWAQVTGNMLETEKNNHLNISQK